MANFRASPSNFSKVVNKSIQDQSAKVFAKGQLKFQKLGIPLVKKEVVSTIESGKSPVAGHGKYKTYSPIYKKQIQNGRYKQYGKKISPVNLTLSGKMLKSIKGRKTKTGFTVFFSDEKAKFHDTPGIARVLRKMLPTGTQTLNRNIVKKINDLLRSIFK